MLARKRSGVRNRIAPLLCITIATAWLASMYVAFGYGGRSGYDGRKKGHLALAVTCGSVVYSTEPRLFWWDGWGCSHVQPYGFMPRWRPWLFSGMGTGVSIPLWGLLLIVAIPPVVRWRRSKKRSAGHCKTCGYDLTGNESQRCPECGTATSTGC